jgi:hypothetical protein
MADHHIYNIPQNIPKFQFHPRGNPVGFVMEKMALRQVIL